MSSITRLVGASAILLLAGACTSTVSRGVNSEGSAAEIVFPAVSTAWLSEGTFANVDNLRAMGAGLSKDQVYDLLGTPHFREGLFGVREWDYVFNFRSGSGVTTCQYKVLFDKDYLARNFHWKPDNCSAMLAAAPAPAVAAATPAPAVAAAASRSFRLTADALFALDHAGVAGLKPEGRRTTNN